MVIEDAETLGSLFSRIQCREQINQLLMAYEEIRHPRCVRTYEQYRRLDAAMKYPIGPQQGVRDAIIHRSLAYDDWNHMDEVAFITMWGNLLSGFAYDASEAVDDWWCKWGPFIQLPGTGTKCKLTSAPLQVWISRGWKSNFREFFFFDRFLLIIILVLIFWLVYRYRLYTHIHFTYIYSAVYSCLCSCGQALVI